MKKLLHLKVLRYVMLFSGQWNFKNYNHPALIFYKYYSRFIFCHAFLMTQNIFLTALIQWECKSRIIGMISYYIQYSNTFTMMFLAKCNNLEKCLDYIINYEKINLDMADGNERKVYLKHAKMNNNMNELIAMACTFSAFIWHFITIRYIFSLALADLLVIITVIPFTSILYTVESWPWGVVVCKVSESAKDISIGVSVFTLTALSAERYCAIVNPLRRLQTKPLTVISAGMIWLLATGFALPDAICSRLDHVRIPDSNKTITFCSPFPNISNVEIYAKYNIALKSLIYYFIPLIIIACFYVLMAIRLHHSANEMPGEIRGTQSVAQARARRHVARMVLIFVFLFFICFLPHHVFMLWFHLYPNAQDEYNDWWHALRIIGFCLSFLNSCVNPVALYCVSGVFRAHFNRYLCCRDPRWPRNTLSTANCETSFNSTYRRHTQNTTVENQSIYRKGTIARKNTEDANSLALNASDKNDTNEIGIKNTMILRSQMEMDRGGYCS